MDKQHQLFEETPKWDTCPYRASERDGSDVGSYPIVTTRAWTTIPPTQINVCVSVPVIEMAGKYRKLDSQPGFHLSRCHDDKGAFLSAPFNQMEAMARAVLGFCEQQRAEWREQFGDRLPVTTEVGGRDVSHLSYDFAALSAELYKDDVWPRIK